MTTWNDLIDETKDYLYSGQRDPLNFLGQQISDSTTSLVLEEACGTELRAGVLLSVGLEIMLVKSTTKSTKTVSVVRGYRGSQAAPHPAGELVWIGPKFPDFSIWRALRNELGSLSSPQAGLYAVATEEVTRDGDDTYPFAPDSFLSIIDVRDPSSDLIYPHRAVSWELADERIRLQQLPHPDSLSVRYRHPFVLPAEPTADVTESGLYPEAFDIPPLGAAARLVAPREVKRSSIEGQTDARRAEEVPPGTSTNATRTLLALRAVRLTEETARLSARYPYGRS